MKLILIGIQGAGKSTQGNILSEKLGIPYLSTGHIFRDIAKEKTKIGRYIKEIMNAGYLIPDEKTVEIVKRYLEKSEYANGYIIDGFPRTVAQAQAFENGTKKAIYLKVSDEEALKRISFRNGNGRADETPKAIAKRIESFHVHTEPVINYYRQKGMLIEVDGERSIEEISEEILRNLGK
ncbi:MAG: nucleoside monophosphate kinase [Candidatus Levybacteria bacterium]|nr:nucleoside monophosphate kinase [Candidatus Levybacteria bacterium]